MPTHPSDERLLKQFIDGDRSALGKLAERYETALLGLACGILNGRQDVALDVVQETWMRVIRYGRSFNGRSSVKTWLYRVTINQCKNTKPIRKTAEITSELQATQDQANPSWQTERAETSCELQHALEQLGPLRRSVILLCYHAGMTHEQAAEILEIPLGTLKSRLHAALQELRARLAEKVST